jgi:hypothetical protein
MSQVRHSSRGAKACDGRPKGSSRHLPRIPGSAAFSDFALHFTFRDMHGF